MFYLLIALFLGLINPSDISADPNTPVVTTSNGGEGEGDEIECSCEDPETCEHSNTDTGGENGPIRPPKP